MTVFSFMMTGCRGNRPLQPEFKREYIFDSLLTIDKQAGIIPVPTFPGVYFSPYEPIGGVVDKFRNKNDYPHFAIHQPNTFCELVIDDADWDGEFMPGYSSHDEKAKTSTVLGVASSLMLALRFCGYDQFILSMYLIGSTLNDLHEAEDGSVTLIPYHPISSPHPPHRELEFSKQTLSKDEYYRVLNIHSSLYDLYYEKTDFQAAADALAEYYFDTSMRTKMISIWAGIEGLVKAPSNGLRRALRTRISMLLGKDNKARKEIFKRVGKLYDQRCDAVHGKKFAYQKGLRFDSNNVEFMEDAAALMGSYMLLEKLLLYYIDEKKVYNYEELEKLQKDFFRLFPELG